jgi:hypothetical protein
VGWMKSVESVGGSGGCECGCGWWMWGGLLVCKAAHFPTVLQPSLVPRAAVG